MEIEWVIKLTCKKAVKAKADMEPETPGSVAVLTVGGKPVARAGLSSNSVYLCLSWTSERAKCLIDYYVRFGLSSG